MTRYQSVNQLEYNRSTVRDAPTLSNIQNLTSIFSLSHALHRLPDYRRGFLRLGGCRAPCIRRLEMRRCRPTLASRRERSRPDGRCRRPDPSLALTIFVATRRVLSSISRVSPDWHHVSYTIKSHTRGRYWELSDQPEHVRGTYRKAIHTGGVRGMAGEKPNPNRESGQFRGSHRLTSRPRSLSTIFRGLHAQAVEAPSTRARPPCSLIRTNRDNRYLSESFQALPANGYTALFERITQTHRVSNST